MVTLLDLGEAIFSLRQLLQIEWVKSFAAGMVLKYSLLSFLLFCAECIFSFKDGPPAKFDWLKKPLKRWLQAHRMAFDLLVSSIIFWPLSLVVLLDKLRELAGCNGMSLHHIFIFRDPGHTQRRQATFHVSDGSGGLRDGQTPVSSF